MTEAARGRARGPRYLPPDWPLAALFIGYPLWWLVGIADMAGILAAAAMAVQLARRGRVRVPRGFGLWALFLVWVVVGVFVLQVDAPGAVPGASGTRYLTWTYRLAYYLAATVVLLYVGNQRKELSFRRVSRILSWMFVTVVAGGLLGYLAPHLDFPSVLEIALPHHVTQIPFVRAQIHPTVAELQNVLGYENPRPSAPFAYSNTWGLNFACLLPFFVSSWCSRDAGRYRLAAPVVLVAALVPVIFSLNRGLWFALMVMAVFVVVQAALHGNFRMLAALLVAGVAVGGLVAFTPLGSTIEARFSSQDNSNEARTHLGSLSVGSMAERSPVVGFGSTREVQGSFISIAAGKTASCPHCSPPALGTQGRLWLVAFSQGFVGLALYLGFFVLQFLRHIRMRGGDVIVGLCVLLVQSVTLPIYDWSGSALFAVMIAIALLWRARVDQGLERSRVDAPLADLFANIRRHGAVLAGTALAGALAAGVWQYWAGLPSVGSVSVLVPAEPQFPGLLAPSALAGATRSKPAPTTLDTEAQLLSSRRVTLAVERAVGAPYAVQERLSVTADPNTRILNISFTAGTSTAARAAADAAADTLLAMHLDELRDRRATALAHLSSSAAALEHAVNTLDASARRLRRVDGDVARAQVHSLRDRRDHLISQWSHAEATVQRVASLPLDPGHVVRPASAHVLRNDIPVPICSGLMVGLLLGLGLAVGRDVLGRRSARAGRIHDATGLPVLARVPASALVGPIAAGTTTTTGQQVALGLGHRRPDAYLSASDDPLLCALASALDEQLGSRSVPAAPAASSTVGVVLVTSRRERMAQLSRWDERMAGYGVAPVGIVLVG